MHKIRPPDVLQLKEVEKPNPKDNGVPIGTYAAKVTSGDVKLRSLPRLFWLPLRIMFGLRKPRNLGYELAGEIGSVGKDAKLPRKGGQVFGTTTGLRFGSYAEYTCPPGEGVLATKPANMTYEEAAAVEYIMVLYGFYRDYQVETGQRYGVSPSSISGKWRDIEGILGLSQFDPRYSVYQDPGAALEAMIRQTGMEPPPPLPLGTGRRASPFDTTGPDMPRTIGRGERGCKGLWRCPS